jgi:molybdopterin synthase catalytic subunit
MRVRVLFFGRLREITGCAEDRAEVGDSALLEDVFNSYCARYPEMRRLRGSMAASRNQEFCAWDARLCDGDEVAFLPPVSGGEETVAEAQLDICRLVREPIRMEEVAALVKAHSNGAVCTFEGVVRDHSGQRETLHLEYEAYEAMAIRTLREIAGRARAQFAIDRVAIVHRLGRLEIGETSVCISVSAAHRAAAFDACRFLIETLKRAVPIWKKEYFRGGAMWVEGYVPASPDRLSAEGATSLPADESIS